MTVFEFSFSCHVDNKFYFRQVTPFRQPVRLVAG